MHNAMREEEHWTAPRSSRAGSHTKLLPPET